MKKQYHNANNLNARIQLHQRFSTNQASWLGWVFDHFILTDRAAILEIGCAGVAELRDRLAEDDTVRMSQGSARFVHQRCDDFEVLHFQSGLLYMLLIEIPIHARLIACGSAEEQQRRQAKHAQTE